MWKSILFSLTDEYLLPVWAWITIALIVVAFATFVIVYYIKTSKKDNGDVNEWEKSPSQTESKSEKAKNVPVGNTPDDEYAIAKEPPKSEYSVQSPAKNELKKTQNKGEQKTATEKKASAPAKTTQSRPAAKSADKPATEKAVQSKPAAKSEQKPAAEKSGAKVYHISKRKQDDKWQIKAEKAEKAIKLFSTQAEALEYVKTLAENQDARIVIHKEDGSFRNLTYKKK